MNFNYKGDRFHFSFKATLGYGKETRFYSYNYAFAFHSFKDYWKEVGRRQVLLEHMAKPSYRGGPKGLSELEAIQKLARIELGDNPGVILYDINLQDAGRLAERFPGVNASLFLEHFIILPTKNREAAITLAEALPLSLTRTLAFSDGIYVTDNLENRS